MAEFKATLQDDCGFSVNHSAKRNPQSNATLEQAHQMTGNMLRAFEVHNNAVADEGDPWSGILSVIAFAAWATVHSASRATPMQMVLGHDAMLDMRHLADWRCVHECKQEQTNALNVAENGMRIPHAHKPGDQVLITGACKRKCGTTSCLGPCIVERVSDNGTLPVDEGPLTDACDIRNIAPRRSWAATRQHPVVGASAARQRMKAADAVRHCASVRWTATGTKPSQRHNHESRRALMRLHLLSTGNGETVWTCVHEQMRMHAPLQSRLEHDLANRIKGRLQQQRRRIAWHRTKRTKLSNGQLMWLFLRAVVLISFCHFAALMSTQHFRLSFEQPQHFACLFSVLGKPCFPRMASGCALFCFFGWCAKRHQPSRFFWLCGAKQAHLGARVADCCIAVAGS